MLNKSTIEKGIKFCCEDIHNIENYEEAVTSEKRYCCHHKLGLNVSYKELIEKGLYYDRPASELIFLEIGEHRRLHMQNLREETRKKMSDGNKGKHHTEETRKKISDNHPDINGENNPMARQCTINGKTYGCLKDAYRELKPVYSYSIFTVKYKEGKL